MNNQNVLTLSPSMKEALAFVATEDLVEKKKLKRPRSKTFEALEKRGMIFQGSTVYACSLTEKGRRAFEAI